MEKQIKQLVENLFNDIYDIDQENNIAVEIADKISEYKVGDIYYKRKKPYAICCGESKDFSNNNPRFISLNFENYLQLFNKPITFYINNNFKKNDIDGCIIKNNKVNHIDENGYENTQVIKNKIQIDNLRRSGFYSMLKKSDDLYLPAIDELQIMCFNIDILNNIIIEKTSGYAISETDTDKVYDVYWSSTQHKDKDYFYTTVFDHNLDIIINTEYIYTRNIIRPFVKI